MYIYIYMYIYMYIYIYVYICVYIYICDIHRYIWYICNIMCNICYLYCFVFFLSVSMDLFVVLTCDTDKFYMEIPVGNDKN